jgi:hypothetical protein
MDKIAIRQFAQNLLRRTQGAKGHIPGANQLNLAASPQNAAAGGGLLGGAAGAASGDDYSLSRILGGAAAGAGLGYGGAKGLKHLTGQRHGSRLLGPGVGVPRQPPPSSGAPIITPSPAGAAGGTAATPARQAGQEAARKQLALPQHAGQTQQGAVELEAGLPSLAERAAPRVAPPSSGRPIELGQTAGKSEGMGAAAKSWMNTPEGKNQMFNDLRRKIQAGKPLSSQEQGLARQLGVPPQNLPGPGLGRIPTPQQAPTPPIYGPFGM